MAIVPYIEDVTDKISRELKKWKIKSVFTAPGKVKQLIGNVKDPNPELVTPGVYEIPCSCGMVYIGQTGRSVRERLNEHIRNTNLNQTEKSPTTPSDFPSRPSNPLPPSPTLRAKKL